jgi:orotidine-5'-phosphate decarboxylase
MLVVGATYPEEIRKIRSVVGDMPFLVPGIGAQGGDVQKTVQAGQNSQGRGMIIHSARAIIFASSDSNFATFAAQAAQKLRDEINQFRF